MSKINNSNAKKDEIVNFPHHLPIELVYSKAITYKPGSPNDSATKAKPNAWHQIVVHHKNVVEGADGKQIILDAIFNAINGKELYPVAYRQRQDKDVFLVRDCKPALDELFKLNLVIQTATGRYLNIEVQLNVAEYKIGQVSPLTAIPTLLNKLLCSYKGHKGILNLSEFANRKEFFEVSISLTSRGVLQRICDTIYKNDALFRQINGLVLSDNGINCLEPLKVFENMPLVVLDLRRNQLSSGTRLAKELANIKADELFLEGNPLLKDSSSYRQFLKEVMNNFPRVDNKPIQELLKTKLPKEIDPVKHGYRIDWTNKDHIMKFSGSLQWHAVMIPDPEHAYDKTSIIGYFFLTISPELGELYPCYYKYVNGEHQFMLRDCFEQLQFLVEQRSLQITIPTLFNIDNPEYQPLSLHYYLLMNVSHFTKDQVEMKSALSKAMTSRYRIVDRVLDLSNLQKAKGLEQIVINLSCPMILQRVLTIAARKYTSNCVELYLCNNLIVSANVPRILALMDNLRVLDLGNNWIHDLADISDLSGLNLVSLRLDGNPLCSKYSLAGEYIKAVQAEFPTLKRLDNKEIPQNAYLCPQKNYLCSVEGYDFVDQFVPTYFKLFESAKRAELNEMYYPKSILSITYNFETTNQNPYKEERLNKYRKHSRNLLKRSLEERELYTGQVAIMNVLMALPMVEYDMLSFKTDTILYNADMVMLSISGVFMDKGSSLEDADMLLYFTRSFILKRIMQNVGELNCGQLYKISNDLLHICHPTRFQKENAFKIVVQKEITKTEGPTKGKDKDVVLVVFQAITSLKTVWCKRCLEDGKWDMKAALEVFAKLCDTNEIPLTAFK